MSPFVRAANKATTNLQVEPLLVIMKELFRGSHKTYYSFQMPTIGLIITNLIMSVGVGACVRVGECVHVCAHAFMQCVSVCCGCMHACMRMHAYMHVCVWCSVCGCACMC